MCRQPFCVARHQQIVSVFADKPAGTLVLCAQGTSSGGEKQLPLVPLPPQVLDVEL